MSPHPPLSAGPAGGRPYGSGAGGAPAVTPLPANALYTSRHRLRAWPGVGGGGGRSWIGNRFVRLSPPTSGLAEGAAEGRSAGLGDYFLRFPPPTSGQARRRRRRGVQLDRDSLGTPLATDFGPGSEGAAAGCAAGWRYFLGAGGGARCLGPEFAFLSFTHRPLGARPTYAWSLVPTLSKTVDQTPAPDGMGKAGAFTV